jgi:hypothetical protein
MIFHLCGLDPYDKDKDALVKQLQSLSKEALYNALLQVQQAENL